MKMTFRTLAFVMVASLTAAAADIYEIRPCDQFGIQRSAYATYADPLTTVKDNTYYFTIRLQVRDAADLNPNYNTGTGKVYDPLHRWYELKHIGSMPESWDKYIEQNRFGIGVFVSGQESASTTADGVTDSGKLEYAKLVSIYANTNSYCNFFDCVFEYKMKSGHFALPVRLAVKDKSTGKICPADDATEGSDYCFCNADKWQVRYRDTDDATRDDKAAVWQFAKGNYPDQRPSDEGPSGDYTLAGAGLYVQTVDFDQTSWEGTDFWREVPMGGSITCPVKAFAEAAGVAEDTVLYVWSMNDSVLKINGGEQVEIITNWNAGVAQTMTNSVGTLTISGGSATADFEVLGVLSNRIADVILSPWKGFRVKKGTATPIKDYKAIPIKCGPKPPPSVYISYDPDYPQAEAFRKLTVEASTNYNDRVQDRIPLYVTLSQAYEHDMDVQIKVEYEANKSVDAITNKLVAIAEHDDGFSPTDVAYTNITFKAGETQKEVSLYALGGNAATKQYGIRLSPVIPDPVAAAKYATDKGSSLLYITAVHAPVIVNPKDETDYGIVSGAAGEGFLIEDLLVNDVYRDLVNTNGFEISFSGALKDQPKTNVVFGAEGQPVNLLITRYNKEKETQQTGTITVTEPADPLDPGKTRKTAKIQVSFTVQVEQPKLVYVSLYDTTESSSLHDGTLFNEGKAPIPMFSVNEPMTAGEKLYFFLRPLNAASSNYVSCAAFTQGIELVGGSTETKLNKYFALNFLDGRAITEYTGSLEYEIFARTAPTLTSGTESKVYTPASKLVLNVANVAPTVRAVYVNGADEAVANDPEAVWKHQVNSGVDVSFDAKLYDPSKDFDVSNGLVTVWRYTDGRDHSTYKWDINQITNNTEILTVSHQFSYAGGSTQDVKVIVLDKDILARHYKTESYTLPKTNETAKIRQLFFEVTDAEQGYGVVPYEFRVWVGKKPCVNVYFPDNGNKDTITILEDAKSGGMAFELTEAASEDLDLHVTVNPLNESGNAGVLQFVSYDLEIKNGETTPRKTTDYNNGLKFKYSTLDGTAGSYDDGFYVTVAVTTEGPRGTNYYEKGEAWIYVQNTPPVISPSEPAVPTTNRTVAVGQNFTITWRAKDVAADLAGDGLTARWYDNGGEILGTKTNVTTATANKDIVSTLVLRQEGLHEVRLEVTDKEGEDAFGKATRSWYYFIEPTKKVMIRAYGPSSDSETYYTKAGGRGTGHVGADGTLDTVYDFYHTYSYGVSTPQAAAFAAGYASKSDAAGNPVSYDDNGSLSKHDVALASDGTKYVSGAYYSYDGEFDNYFYRWMINDHASTSNSSSNWYSEVKIHTKSGVEVASPLITLDPYVANKTGYTTREVEAIFSREAYRSDNLGDINADGIPDLYTYCYQFDVFDDAGKLVGSDLEDTLPQWTDGDYLPTSTSFTLIDAFGATNTWALSGELFDPIQEIRGYNDQITGEMSCFNDAYQILAAGIGTGKANSTFSGVSAEIRFTDPETDEYSTLSKVEWLAFKAYCDAKGWDPADDAHWGIKQDPVTRRWSYDNSWSPERPTNPNRADTDGDGLTDGLEYYLWYKSHVGELDANMKLVRRVGRRYNPLRPLQPDIIPADTVAELFDPLAKGSKIAERDTDNDGLTDLEEFVLGTDPTNYDSDHDGLPDGYEVHVLKLYTDPLHYETYPGKGCDANLNPDHDQMAFVSLKTAKQVLSKVYSVDLDAGGNVTGTNGIIVSMMPLVTEGDDITSRHLVAQKGVRWQKGIVYDLKGRIALVPGASDDWTEVVKLFVTEPVEDDDALVIHGDVYAKYGFDPRTGWNWAQEATHSTLLNTKDYTNLDEFMLQAVLFASGAVKNPEESVLLNWSKYCTNPLNADTDGDAMPDGWELYVGFDPLTEPEVDDVDKDGLSNAEEFAGVESSLRYSDCETIPEFTSGWQNKVWPTDPNNPDTDGDGLKDGQEKAAAFIYGSIVRKGYYRGCSVGGGLNPCSWDTDLDYLPDPFEFEFAGTYSNGVASVSSTNATVAAGTGAWNNDGMDGTVPDAELDYDHDGLLNWQEYMVGTMRCWRYDDTISKWTSHTVDSDKINFGVLSEEEQQLNIYNMFFNPASEDYNPGMSVQHFSPLVYMTCNNVIWEKEIWLDVWQAEGRQAYGYFYYFKDGIHHDLKKDATTRPDKQNRWHRAAYQKLTAIGSYPVFINAENYPARYICCNPCKPDTDMDGMDDFYELFHGLNPMLGQSSVNTETGTACDIIFDSWQHSLNPLISGHVGGNSNMWIQEGESLLPRPDVGLRLKGTAAKPSMDFFQYPWLAGLPTADPDGDNIRNIDESIMANIQAESTYLHTDPTPLWMTDLSYDDSLTFRYYQSKSPYWASPTTGFNAGTDRVSVVTESGVTGVYYFAECPWLQYEEGLVFDAAQVQDNFAVLDTMFSYEQNEGFDTDKDYLSDFEETQGKTKSASDPQDHDSPIRRQAAYFGGAADPGFFETPLRLNEYGPEGPVTATDQSFLYYTVECWCKPDADALTLPNLQTMVERVLYTGPAGPADERYVRKNFLIGLRNGRWYTKFDSSGVDQEQFVEVTGRYEATTNWTHLAATFDGKTLNLYVNGISEGAIDTGLKPEHGVSAAAMDAMGQSSNQDWQGGLMGGNRELLYRYNAILVGASAQNVYGICYDWAWHTRSMANADIRGVAAKDAKVADTFAYDGLGGQHVTTIDDYGNFFKGYIDEVRIWDGARKQADIESDVKNRVRYDAELAKTNRQKIYDELQERRGRTKNSTGELSAELRYHWTFDQLPSATKKSDLITSPHGFTTGEDVTDGMAIWARPKNWTNNWLMAIDPTLRSNCYTSNDWIPYVQDTVSTLPIFDKRTRDSAYWKTDSAGGVPAIQNNANFWEYGYANTREPYNTWVQMLSSLNPQGVLAGANHVNYSGDEYEFSIRESYAEGCALIPLGGVYAKRVSASEGGMWDDLGAADAWAYTQVDTNNDGLPDWWVTFAQNQGYATGPVVWSDLVTYRGVRMPAWEAYKRDLVKGLLPDGVYHDGKNTPDDFRDTRDLDQDGIPDWWEDIYGVNNDTYADAYTDSDNDGLNNYIEYLLSEIFDIEKDGVRLMFDPSNPYSIDGRTSDYFFRLGELYVGEIFADHDRMSDRWEHDYLPEISPYLYDAGGDPDNDGWSNYAEFQANTDPTRLGAIGIDDVQINEYPVPTVEISINYEGSQNVIDKSIVVKAWHDPSLETKPDAVWTIGQAQEATVTKSGNTNIVAGTKHIGVNPNKEMLFHLSPGSIVKGSVKFEFKDTNWSLYELYSGQTWIFDAANATWQEVLNDRGISGENSKGEIVDKMSGTVVGSIDYVTGAVVLDLTKVSESLTIDGDASGTKTAAQGERYISVYDLSKSYIRVKWNAKPVLGGTQSTYYLSEADSPSADGNNSLGHLKEGRNTFIAFYDLDGDGMYTAGEPYGAAYNVDVGWNYAKVVVELTDTHAVTARFNTQDGTNDRTVLYGRESGDMDPSVLAPGSVSGGRNERVRVVRTLVDGAPTDARVVLQKDIVTDNESLYITEADFLCQGALDIDWEYLAADLKARNYSGPVTSVSYRVVLGNGSVSNADTNNLLNILFNRNFDVEQVYIQERPVPLDDAGTINAASPTFRWTTGVFNSYTAFQIKIYDGTTEVWDSGARLMPVRVKDAEHGWHYEWTAPIFAGDKLLNGKVFENNKNYTWKLRVLNAKFKNNVNGWSSAAGFRMNVLTNSTDYSVLDVAVRHYGPAAIRSKGTIRVQAFLTPDFTGTPVGQGYVDDLSEVGSTNLITRGNAKIYGLTAGNYYLRAFVDTNDDGVCQDWETWGFSCIRDRDAGKIYSPRSVKIGPDVGHRDVIALYLEDSDTDKDNLPDAWEMVTFGSLTSAGVSSLDQTLVNGLAVKTSLTGNISTADSLKGGLSVRTLTTTALGNPYVAALVCGVSVNSGESADAVAAALCATADELDEENTTVEITSVSLDAENRVVHVGVAGSLINAASSATAFYSFAGTAGKTYGFEVLRKNTLMDVEWQKVAEVSFTLGLNEADVDIPLPADIDLDSGFFMLREKQ